jgi:hypothetical protein
VAFWPEVKLNHVAGRGLEFGGVEFETTVGVADLDYVCEDAAAGFGWGSEG